MLKFLINDLINKLTNRDLQFNYTFKIDFKKIYVMIRIKLANFY